MKKLYIFLTYALFPYVAFPQYQSKDFTTDVYEQTTSVALDVSVSNADTIITLHQAPVASGMFVSGSLSLANVDDSYVRFILRDDNDIDYLIYEVYPLLTETSRTTFSKIGLETAYLYNVRAQSIRIEAFNAAVSLDSVHYITAQNSQRDMRKAVANRKSQCEYIANKLNDRLVRENGTWRAGVTFISQMTHEEKKGMFGRNVPILYGFDYYKGGIFVMPGFSQSVSESAITRSSDDYVKEWDWRNRHGKNWLTCVKNQSTCHSCSAFSAIGTFESYINLYYNQLINIDLSEQELVSCGPVDCVEGAYMPDVLRRIKSLGAIPEECFEYTATQNYCHNKCLEPFDVFSFAEYSDDYSDSYFQNHSSSYMLEEDSIKRMLFRSPICFGIRPWLHFVVLAGYKQIHSGENYFTSMQNFDTVCFSSDDPLVGHPAWLIKNSIGHEWGENGFGYVALSLADVYGIYKLTGNVTSEIFNDDDIVCEDADGDGYFNWGIGPRPLSCPSWAPMEEDGDDSDCTKGPLDQYGNLLSVDPDEADTIYIDVDDDFTYSTNKYVGRHIKISDEAYLTVSSQLFCCNGVSITIEEGSRLIVRGGEINNVILKPQKGSSIVIEDGGRIRHNKTVNFKIPIGVVLEQRRGIIE